MTIKPSNVNATTNIEAAEEEESPTPPERTDMAKVNYYLSRPMLLLRQLPESRREALAGHIGRRRFEQK